jgi:predicted transposase/invertase (TIGR01784 family)
LKIQEVELIDSKLRQETEDDKLSVLDVKAKLCDGKIVNIEMQVERFAEMKKRGSFYSDGMVVEQLGSGGQYGDIKPVISIIIVAKSLITESKKCHNVFKMLEVEEHFAFNDLQ